MVTLVTGGRIEIPHLEQPILEAIFATHTLSIEQESSSKIPQKIFKQDEPPILGFPLKFGAMPMSDNMEPLIGHNPDQADAPDLPKEMLNKISSIAKVVAGDNIDSLPKPEPHCNCPYCQIANAIQDNLGSENNETETSNEPELAEEISDEDLKFSDWFIQQIAEKVYSVTNPFDQKEQYNVYLGEPVGCTCGQKDCKHIQAVLRT